MKDVNHTEVLYQITKITKEALERVEKGYSPYDQYDKIKKVIDEEPGYRKNEELKGMLCAYLILALIFLLIAISVVSVIAAGIFLFKWKIIAMFGCIFLFCLAFPAALCLMVEMDKR